MRLLDYTFKLLGLSETIHKWHGSLSQLGQERREKVARYSEEVAATLARVAAAFATLERDPRDTRARRDAIRELGRMAGYLEDLVATLQDHLDGRKLAGVKRRLERLSEGQSITDAIRHVDGARVERLLEAEGYFRALADGLRT